MSDMNDKEKDIAKENLESNESGQKQYAFITETIKKRPVNKKRIFGKIIMTVVMALIFGAIASVTLALLYPLVNDRLNPEQMKEVTIPLDEEIIEEPMEDFVPVDDEEELSEEENDSKHTDDDKSESLEHAGQSDLENALGENDEKEVVVNQVVETIEKELELDDYRTLYRKISSVGNSVLKSMVKVSCVSDATDWFSNKYEDNNTVSGVIIADNGKELLIVSNAEILEGAEQVEVTFCDGRTYKSSIKNYDANTGLSVVAVDLLDIDESTKEKIEMATFGSLSGMMNGTPVLAVGSPQGINDSMAMGQITSSAAVDIIDGSVRVVSTDIYGSTSASGVIVNLNGRILGFICHKDLGQDMPNLIRAYSIIDLKDKIEKVSNNQKLAKLGIIGTDVTETAFNELGVPFGTYVKKVDIDSPAMKAGIRSGDVIVKFGTTEINSFNDYKSALLKSQPGDIVNVTLMRPGKNAYSEITYEVTLESI